MKRRVLCAVCAALCLLSGGVVFPAQADVSPGCFTYDMNDWDRTHLSSGTGGTELREAGVKYDEYGAGPPELTDPVVLAMIDEWAEDAAQKLNTDMAKIEGEDYTARISGRFINDALYRVKISVTSEKTDEEDWDAYEHICIQTAVFDVERRRQLSLSDLFYDGVNYIDYINQSIVDGGYSEIHASTGTQSPWAEKTPFTGLPRDYPYFSMLWDYLRIEMDDHNPFWLQPIGFHESAIFVPLTHWMSPWGDCKQDVRYHESELANGMRFLAPILLIDEGREPEAEQAINAMLAEMSERIMRETEQIVLDEEKWMEPCFSRVREWSLVDFDLKHIDYGLVMTERTLDFAMFNLHTGEILDPATVVERFQESLEVTYAGGQGGERVSLPAYRPPASAEITDMYLSVSKGERLVVVLQDADAVIKMEIPLRLLDAEKPPYPVQ